MKIDGIQYKKSISPNRFWKLLLLFGLSYIVFLIFNDTINTYWVGSCLKYFPNNIFVDLLCITALFYLFLKIKEVIKNKLLPTIASLLFACLTLVFYLFLIRCNGKYNFYSFRLPYLNWVKYSDVLLLIIGITTLDFRGFNTPLDKKSIRSLTADEPDPEKIVDLIKNESYVQKIALAVNETACQLSYAIGVFASWGSGKTDFLLRLKKALQTNKEENVIIEFNPWKAATVEGILEDFFAVLATNLKPYNKSVAAKLKSYSKKILASGKEAHYRLADTLLDEFIMDTSLQEKYTSINDTIKYTGKRFVIVIDDLDRMTGIEVMQVLRIIRNSANFSNTFFIVALDHEYIVNVLQKTNLFSKEEQYLKKIFQLIITLPQIRKATFSHEISRLLIYDQMPVQDKDKIERAISLLKYDPMPSAVFGPFSSKEDGHIEQMLDNYRDVKRFCNSFRINFDILKDEVEVTDLFLLELIKAKSFYVYESIANKNFLDHTKEEPHNYTLNLEAWKYFEDTSNLDAYTLNSLKSAINSLLRKNNFKGNRQFLYPHNFYLYFCYQLFNLISLEEFQKAIELPWREMRKAFDKWDSEGKHIDLWRILDNITDFRDKDQFEKFLKVFLFNKSEFDYTSRASQMVMDIDRNVASYFTDKSAYKEFIHSILQNNDLPEYDRAIVANALLKNSVYKSEDLLLPKAELQEIIYNLFDKYLDQKKDYDEKVNEFYLLNDDYRDKDHFVYLYSKAHKRLFDFLSIPENFEGYLRYLIRSYSLPTDGHFAFAPFTKDIFENWTKFQTKVQEHTSNDEALKALIPIIIRHTKEYIDGKDKFLLEGEEKELVLKHLRSTKQYNFQ